jgi:ubiquinone biosynthesis protein
MFNNIRYYFRSLQIAFTLLKNRNNIAKAFEKLGPSFIKLGQFLSTRPDLIGNEFCDSLGYLRDKLPAFSFQLVSKTIKKEFNQDLELIYSSFEQKPIAAASISQVHKATTIEGNIVAVKVLRPNIEIILKRDIKFFYFIAKKVEYFFPKYKRLKLNKIVETLETSFKLELDLSFEAAAAAELHENNKSNSIIIPQVDWLRTGKKIFTMQWIDGISIYKKNELIKNKIDLEKLATNFTIMFFHQAFSDGFFHADLHQGNIMVNNEGKIILLDFGIMGRLDYKNRIYVAMILHGFLKRDYSLIAKIHHDAGFVSKDFMAEEFAQSCRAIGEPIMNLPPEQISIAKLLKQLFDITEKYQMETQPQLLLLQKTMIMVEGIGKTLYPKANLWHLVEEPIEEWAKENISLEAKLNKAAKGFFNKILEKIENIEI